MNIIKLLKNSRIPGRLLRNVWKMIAMHMTIVYPAHLLLTSFANFFNVWLLFVVSYSYFWLWKILSLLFLDRLNRKRAMFTLNTALNLMLFWFWTSYIRLGWIYFSEFLWYKHLMLIYSGAGYFFLYAEKSSAAIACKTLI